MGEDTDTFHGLPAMGTLSTGRYSPTGNGHPKQSQQHFPPCTTQASPSAMTDYQAGALSGYRTPSTPSPPQKHETYVSADIPRPSQSPELEAGPQNGAASAAEQDLMLADQLLKQEYCPEDLRMKDLWLARASDSEERDEEYAMIQRKVPDTAAVGPSSQPAQLSQGSDGYAQMASQSRGWVDNSQNLFQQPYAWTPLPTSTHPALNQPFYNPNHFDLFAGQGLSSTNSAPYNAEMGSNKRLLGDVDPNCLNFSPTTTSAFSGYTLTAKNVAITSLSPPASLSFYDAPPTMRQDREDTVPYSEGDIDQEYKDGGWYAEDLLGGSPSSIEGPGNKVDEPYAQLIYRAFLSRPNKSMTLQEIYQWFRENTDKAKAEGKGWQNSIRHNLSMNGAFTKRNSKPQLSSNVDGSSSLDATGVDVRKSTEWCLEPSFYAGVESTTRYRKGNSGSRSRTASGHPARSRPGSDGQTTGNFCHARVSAGRKGGNVAAQNRKRLAERQHQARQLEISRGHPRHMHMTAYHGRPVQYSAAAAMYAGEGGEAYNTYQQQPSYPPQHHAWSPPSTMPVYGGVVARQHTDMIGHNNFGSDDVGQEVHIKRSRTLVTDNEHSSEPLTPPGSGCLDDPPRSADDPFGSGKHQEFLLNMNDGLYNPLNSYQHALESSDGAHGQQQQQPQQPSYTLADVTGIYNPPAGCHPPPLFVDQEFLENADDQMLLDLALPR